MKSISRALLVAFALLCAATASAQAQSADVKALAAQLKSGGYVIVFRHGATNRDQADTDPLNYENVAKQRLLSENGKQVAVQVGAAFKTLGIPVGAIYTSKFNRAVETGKLIGGGEATTTIDITEGGLVATPIENDRRAAAMRNMAATAPAAGKNTLIVSHKPNIIDAFGKDWFDVKEGEASIFQPAGGGKANLVARVQAADWLAAVK
jgi:phosphohistidine phosphatase SixA